MKWFGREPVYLLGFIAALLQALSAFGVDIADGTQTAINAVSAAAVGLISAIVLKNGALAAAIVQLAQTVMALCVGLGLDWSASDQSKVMAAIGALVTLWLREKVTAPVASVALERSSPVKAGPAGV
jgi:predicted amino acid-binding ACT domain protein